MYSSTHLTSALYGGEWSASRPIRFTPRERTPGTHWIGAVWAPEPFWTRWWNKSWLDFSGPVYIRILSLCSRWWNVRLLEFKKFPVQKNKHAVLLKLTSQAQF